MSAYDVAIIGSGPAGLSAAIELATVGAGRIVVLEREAQTGGIPRHSNHQGYGVRDLHRLMTGPRYAAHLTERARALGIEIRTNATVTALVEDRTLHVTSPRGLETITARAIVIATGARERPRPARHVAGDRGSGIFTTGQLQQWVEQAHLPVGKRAVVVGAEHVSFSAIMTLRHAGVQVVEVVTTLPRHQGIRGAALVARWLWGSRLRTNTRVVAVHGSPRVRVLEVEGPRGRSMIACDTVVFTGDWIPDVELARRSAIPVDHATYGPRTDEQGRTQRPGIYAIGNLVHPVETADRCARNAREVAHAIVNDFTHGAPASPLHFEVGPHIEWVWPQLVSPTQPPTAIRFRSRIFARRGVVVATQDGVEIARQRVGRLVPLQHRTLRGDLGSRARPDGGPVTLSLHV